MAITVENRTNIIGLVVGMFGAAPGASVLSDLVASFEAGATIPQIAANLATSTQFQSIYPTFLTNGEFATKVVNSLLAQADATAKADAVSELTSALNGGMSKVDGLLAAIEFANTTTVAAYVTSATAFDNKVAVATYYSVEKQLSGADLDALQQVIANVDNTAASVTAANAASDGTSTVGKTFVFTTGVDTLVGTSGDDTFVADNSVNPLSSVADTVDGGNGNDTVKVYSKAGSANVIPTLTSIEKLWVTGDDQGLSVASQSGLSALEVNAIGATGLTYTVGTQSVTLSDKATAVAAVTIAGSPAALTLSKYGSTASGTVDLSGTTLATAALTSVGSTNQITLTNTGVAVAAVTVKADTALVATIGSGAVTGFKATGITSIDASASAAATTLTVSGGNTAGQNNLATTFSYKGGAANDTLDLKAGFIAGVAITATQLKAMTLDGGAGTDTLVVTNAIGTGAVALTNMTNIENIAVDSTSGTVNMANFAGVTGLTLAGTNGGAVIVNNLASAGSFAQGTSIDGAASVTVNATGTGSADTLAWSVGSATAALGANTGAVAISGYETITLTSQGAANTLGLGGITLSASAGGNETLNIVATKALTLDGAVTLSGATTAVNVSGAGAVTVTGVLTSGNFTSTASGAFTATAANKVLNFDASGSTGAVSFTNSAAVSAAILKGGSGDTTFVASAFNDVITVGAGTNAVTAGAGADVITISHGTGTKATALTNAATDSGVATGFAATTAVPTAAFSTTAMDIVTGFRAGDTIATGVTAAGTLLSNGSTTGSALTGDAILVKGTYSSSANTFTASTSGTDSAFVYDNNGTTGAGDYQAIILVGYVDGGTVDTMSTGGLFTAVA